MMAPEKIYKTMAFFLLLTAIGFLAGIVLMQFIGEQLMETGGIFSYEWISRFLYMEIDSTGFFYYCLQRRLILALILFLSGISFLAIPSGSIFCFFFGLVNGMELALASAQLGVQGPIVYAATCFPQALLYIPGLTLYLVFILWFKQRKKVLSLFIAILLLFTIGCLLESYVNPIILHKMLKKIY